MSEISVDKSVFEDITKSLNEIESELQSLSRKIRSDLGGNGSIGNVNRHLNDTAKAVKGIGEATQENSEQLSELKTHTKTAIDQLEKRLSTLGIDINGDNEYIKPVRQEIRALFDQTESCSKQVNELHGVVMGDSIQRPLREIATEFETDKVRRSGINWVFQAGSSVFFLAAGWFMTTQIYGRFDAIEAQNVRETETLQEVSRQLEAIKQKGDRNESEIERLRDD